MVVDDLLGFFTRLDFLKESSLARRLSMVGKFGSYATVVTRPVTDAILVT